MLNTLFLIRMQQVDSIHHHNNLLIMVETYLDRLIWLLLRMEGEEETTGSMKDEVVMSMDLGKEFNESYLIFIYLRKARWVI